MIEPQTPGVVVHPLATLEGQPAQVIVTESGNLAVIYGDDALAEATLVVRARCPLNGDALGVLTCACSDHHQDVMSVARRAPLGVFAYLSAPTADAWADVLVFLAHLPNLNRVFMPQHGVGDAAFLAETSSYDIVHRPTLLPRDDAAWPGPERRHVDLRLWDRVTGAVSRARVALGRVRRG